MNKSQLTRITVVSIGLLVLLLSGAEARSVNLPSPQCHPSIISSMPPKIRKICDALSTIWEFSDAMENYLDEKGDFFKNVFFCVFQLFAYLLLILFNLVLMELLNQYLMGGVEPSRRELDHIFLRFGR